MGDQPMLRGGGVGCGGNGARADCLSSIDGDQLHESRRLWRIKGVGDHGANGENIQARADIGRGDERQEGAGALPDDLLMQGAMKKTCKEVWDSLKVRFVGADCNDPRSFQLGNLWIKD